MGAQARRPASLHWSVRDGAFLLPYNVVQYPNDRVHLLREMKPPLQGIDHVQLDALPGCESEGRRFFGELLG